MAASNLVSPTKTLSRIFLLFSLLCVYCLLVSSDIRSDNEFAELSESRKSALSKLLRERTATERAFDKKGASERSRKSNIASVNEFIVISYYSSSQCKGLEAQMTIGTNICESVVSDDGLASASLSSSLAYDEGTGIIRTFFSDIACNVSLVSDVVYPLPFTSDYCSNGVEFTIQSYFPIPNLDGTIFSEYATTNACVVGANPVTATWFSSQTPTTAFNITALLGNGGIFDDRIACDPQSVQYSNQGEDDDLISIYSFNATVFTAYAVTEASSSSSSCFAASESVLLASGEVAPIAEIRVGDTILSSDRAGTLRMAEVIAVPHSTNYKYTTFLQLNTKANKSIKLTADHIVMVNSECSNISVVSLATASSLRPGMCLVAADFSLDELDTISLVTGRGIYTVISQEEMLVINGFIVSPFSYNHIAGHSYYNIFRVVYSLSPRFNTAIVYQASVYFSGLMINLFMSVTLLSFVE